MKLTNREELSQPMKGLAMTDMTGKKALEELVADDTKKPPTIWLQSWEDTRGEGQDRLWCEDKVWPDHEDDHEPVKYVRADLAATLEARAALADQVGGAVSAA